MLRNDPNDIGEKQAIVFAFLLTVARTMPPEIALVDLPKVGEDGWLVINIDFEGLTFDMKVHPDHCTFM